MEKVTATDVAKSLQSVSAYAEQLSRAFHRHRLLSTVRIVSDVVEECTGVFTSTIGTLGEVLDLLRREDADTNQNQLFSDEGLRYVNILGGECATILAKIAPTIAKAGQKKERKKKRKNAQTSKVETEAPMVLMQLKLDEEKLLNDLDNAIWYCIDDDGYVFMDRLREVQLRLLLVYQVVTVGSLSRDLSSGKVDIQKIVRYHELINRTADLIGISSSNRRRRSRSCSSSEYTLSELDSDSDVSTIVSRRRRTSRPIVTIHPPPPPPPHVNRGPPPPPRGIMAPPPPPPDMANFARPSIPTPAFPPRIVDLTTPNINPPSYDSHKDPHTPPLEQKSSLQYLSTSPLVFTNEKDQDCKANSPTKPEDKHAVENPQEALAPEGQLFTSPHNRLSFRIKSLFRSKESLAAEMKKVLKNTSSVLEAFLIQGTDIRPIPHSAFHSLEATHMRTILSQLRDDSWLETFGNLTRTEHNALDTAIYPSGPSHLRRELVALKVLQENKNNAWMRLITEKLRVAILPQHLNNRVILAIFREHLVDGKRNSLTAHGNMIPTDSGSRLRFATPPHLSSTPPPPHPGALFQGPPPPSGLTRPSGPPAMLPIIRPPPASAAPNAISGFRFIGSDNLRPPPLHLDDGIGLPTQGMNLPPISQARGPGLPPPPPPRQVTSISGEVRICSDAEAFVALTTYNEFTLRLAEAIEGRPRTWSRITITQESNALPDVLARVNSFNHRGCSIIDIKLRLTTQQATHLSKLLDEIRFKERDNRFEWCLVELSLYDSMGEIDPVVRIGGGEATIMHLIARRTLKSEYIPSDVYAMLMSRGSAPPPHTLPPRPGPRPPMPGPPPPPPVPFGAPPPPVFVESFRPRPRGNWRTRGVSMSDLDSSGSSGNDSDSSYDNRRGRVRRRRRNNGRMRRRYSDSESSDDSDDEEDVIRIPVVLKRGDDVVKKLLDLWTPDVVETAEKLKV